MLIYDHELAFDFTLALFKNPEPWTIRPVDMTNVENNFCYRLLKGKSFDFSNFVARLAVIDEKFWSKAEEVIPKNWQGDRFQTIKEQLNKIISYRSEFASELNRVLS